MSDEETIQFMAYAASMHDIGKADPKMQCNPKLGEDFPITIKWKFEQQATGETYFPPLLPYRHEQGSQEYMQHELLKHTTRDVADIISAILGLHHQGKTGGEHLTVSKTWGSLRDELNQYFLDYWKPTFPTAIKNVDAFGYIATSLIILADWIASTPLLEQSEFMTDDEIRAKVLEFLEQAGLSDDSIPKVGDFQSTWKHAGIKTPSPMQKALADYLDDDSKETPAMILIESEPGSGKTEAAIYAAIRLADAFEKEGIFVGLPTMATANGMLPRIHALQDAHGINHAKLLHSMAWLQNSAIQPGPTSWSDRWLSPTRMGMLQASGIGTIDQCMAGVLPIKYGSLRLLGLSSKVLVIDEIHSYDDYMLAIIRRLLLFCRTLRIPVVMLSATLPAIKKSDLLEACLTKAGRDAYKPSQGYPLITMISAKGKVLDQIQTPATFHRTYSVTLFKNMPVEADLRHLVERVQNGGCAVYYANTVSSAQNVYLYLKKIIPCDCELLLYHAHFSGGRRAEIESQCLSCFGKGGNRPHKAILVSTQVTEMSLDLDFDYVMSELAPIDSLIQRIGREHRHFETKRPESFREPEVTIITSPQIFRSSSFIYDEEYLRRTERFLESCDTLSIPNDLRRAMEFVYSTYSTESDGSCSDALEQVMNQAKRNARSSALTGRLLPKPVSGTFSDPTFWNLECLIDDQDDPIGTRDGQENIRIALIPPSVYKRICEDNARFGKCGNETAAEVLQYSVPIYSSKFASLPKAIQEKFEEGTGRLIGVMFAVIDYEAGQTEDLVLKSGSEKLTFSREMGVI